MIATEFRLAEPCLGDLMHRIQNRDSQALAELHACTHGRLTTYVRRIVKDPHNAEEVVQDVYRQVWFSAARFDADRGSPMAWLYIIARTRALDSTRESRKNQMTVTLEGRVFLAAEADPEEDFSRCWRYAQVRQGLRKLPPHQREVIEMAFFDGYSHSEIALRTGWPLGTVKARIRSALAALRAGLRPDLLCGEEAEMFETMPRTAA